MEKECHRSDVHNPIGKLSSKPAWKYHGGRYHVDYCLSYLGSIVRSGRRPNYLYSRVRCEQHDWLDFSRNNHRYFEKLDWLESRYSVRRPGEGYRWSRRRQWMEKKCH